MDKVVILGVPRSGTTFLTHCVQGLRSTVTMSGILVPPVIPHLGGRVRKPKSVAPYKKRFPVVLRHT